MRRSLQEEFSRPRTPEGRSASGFKRRANAPSVLCYRLVTRRVMALLYNLQTVGLLNAQGNHASRRVNANEREGAGMHLDDLLKTS